MTWYQEIFASARWNVDFSPSASRGRKLYPVLTPHGKKDKQISWKLLLHLPLSGPFFSLQFSGKTNFVLLNAHFSFLPFKKILKPILSIPSPPFSIIHVLTSIDIKTKFYEVFRPVFHYTNHSPLSLQVLCLTKQKKHMRIRSLWLKNWISSRMLRRVVS
jgi:hypothetical protein